MAEETGEVKEIGLSSSDSPTYINDVSEVGVSTSKSDSIAEHAVNGVGFSTKETGKNWGQFL